MDNMFMLNAICNDDFVITLVKIIKWVLSIVMWGVPIAIILLGTFDIGKAVISSDEKAIEKARKTFVNRLLYGILVIFIPIIVYFIFSQVAKVSSNVDNSWWTCWNQVGTVE